MAPRFSPLPFLLILFAGLQGACDQAPADLTPEVAARGPRPSVERTLGDLITALTPLAADTPVGERNAWFLRRRETLDRLRAQGDVELGRRALAAYHERETAPVDVRAGLLDVAAHAVPEEVQPVLIPLIQEYGPDLGLRASACEILAETSPQAAVDVLGPILTGERNRTYPPDDRMMRAWIVAADRLEFDKSEVLARIAMDPKKNSQARQWAIKGLADVPGPRARQALESMLVDSTGNNYVRRLAAQSLLENVDRDAFCAKINEVIENEADLNFQFFLDSMLTNHCR